MSINYATDIKAIVISGNNHVETKIIEEWWKRKDIENKELVVKIRSCGAGDGEFTLDVIDIDPADKFERTSVTIEIPVED